MLRLSRIDRGVKRLPSKVERVIRAVIKHEYLSKSKRITIADAAKTVQRQCRKRGWLAPSKTTIVGRIKALSPAEVDAVRGSQKHAAPGRYEQRRGVHPAVNQILYECQLDHTPSDLCIVDEEHRLPLEGAQTLSVVLDVSSRCVTGFALSMEAPSIRVAGQVVAFAILPKERFLEQMGVDASWPCWGKPTFLYMDSGPDFTSSDFERALDLHNIHVLRRPKSAPNYAAQIESLFSKFLQEVHQLPGSRFSSLKERLAFDPEGHAIMTINEFRRWFTIFITMVYHQSPHSGLNDLPPIVAWQRGILGYGDKPGIGLPDREEDELHLKQDFLPAVRRTIQPEGVKINHSWYQDALLAEWVGAENEDEPDGKFIFKSDSFDVSEVYFLHPRERRYITIPRVDPNDVGSVTAWDIGTVKRQQKNDNRQLVDQRTIDAGMEQMRAVQKEAAERTKAARKARQRDLDAKRTAIPTQRRKQAEGVIQFSDAPRPAVDDFAHDDTVIVPLPGGVASKVRT
jgi:putative transposase